MEFSAARSRLRTSSTARGTSRPTRTGLRSWRSRLLRFDERNETHVQVNRDLTTEFATLLAGAAWDVALLQECPPRFAAPLARACSAEGHRALTSRNSLGPLRGLLARQNPDLMASGEGGSNLTLVRVPGRLGGIAERRELAIHEGAPERRSMALTRTASGVCIANLHATNDAPKLATEDVLLAARAATEFAGGAPLLFGGDLNLRPAEDPEVFERLREELRPDGADGAAGDRPPARRAARRCARRRRPGRRSGASCRSKAGRCASPTTPRSRRGLPRPSRVELR